MAQEIRITVRALDKETGLATGYDHLVAPVNVCTLELGRQAVSLALDMVYRGFMVQGEVFRKDPC